MPKSILVVAAHPDDETLGCGATIAKHTANKESVSVVTLTGGTASRDESTSADETARREAASKAMEVLGAKWIGKGNFPDNQLDTVPLLDIVKYLESFCLPYSNLNFEYLIVWIVSLLTLSSSILENQMRIKNIVIT